LMYTSGTTGTPKGVAISHQNVVNLLQSYAQELSLKPDHRCFSITSMVFDISGLEVYLPLITGSSVYLAHPNALLNVDYVNSVITKNDLTWMQATPSFYRLLVDAGWKPKNLTLLVGGEALNRSLLVDLLADDIKILNCYGPTETTIWSSCAWIAKHDEITIGKPIANTRIYILDNHLQILPVGVPGEIYIAGDGLSAGYHNRPALNEERFVILQLPHAKKERVYKTGDLGYLTPHGSIKYLGRTDSQIKFQGHRVELTEIENTAMQHPAIKQAVVLPSSSADKIDKLIAHIVYHELLQPHQPSFDFSLFYFSSTQSTSDKIYNLLIEGAKFADNHGFSAVWTPERHFHPIGGHFPNPSITSAALSLITKNIQLRAGSVVLPLHSPLRVAEEWSAVDNFSNGRVAVAFASGWNPKDFALAPDVYEKRHALMPKYIDDVQALWAGKSISMKDGNGKIAEVSIYPRPVQATLPMWVTVRGDERTIINAAKAGANLLTHLIGQPLNLLAERIKKYRETLQEHGHDSKSKKVTVMLHAFIWSNFEDAVKHAREPFLAYLREHVAFEIMASSVQDQAEINAEDKEAIIEAAFQRYISTASLIGDVAHCQQIIQNLIGAGVDEVACFIDFGIEEHLVISSFEYLNELKEKVKLIKTPDCSELDSFLKSRLPDMMVPKSYVIHKKLPLTINGKIDHTALKMIDVNLIKQTEKHAKIKRQPETRLEQALAKLWCEIIVIEEVYQDDNFFDVGGYSLLVVQLLAKIKYNFNVSLSVKELYANLTIKSLGALLQEKITDELAVH
jgi:natural product biosynthesis luciferase-like monooxygenase protein